MASGERQPPSAQQQQQQQQHGTTPALITHVHWDPRLGNVPMGCWLFCKITLRSAKEENMAPAELETKRSAGRQLHQRRHRTGGMRKRRWEKVSTETVSMLPNISFPKTPKDKVQQQSIAQALTGRSPKSDDDDDEMSNVELIRRGLFSPSTGFLPSAAKCQTTKRK